MTSTPVELLRLIEPARGRAVDAGGIDGGGFPGLLQAASRGEIASGRAVTIAPRAGVELNASQLERLSAAADRAEASGIHRLMVLMDGMALRLDVAQRQVTGTAALEGGEIAADIDGVIRLEAAPERPVTPPATLSNASLLRALEQHPRS